MLHFMGVKLLFGLKPLLRNLTHYVDNAIFRVCSGKRLNLMKVLYRPETSSVITSLPTRR